MVSLVVRDSAWRTLAPSKLVERTKGERWTVDGHTVVGPGTLLWRLALLPRARGMEVQAALRARGEVVTNRSGLVVLLPATIFAGARFVVCHADASEEHGVLPRNIAPHQPLRDAAALRVSVPRGPALAFTFAGDTFEMEDQRNWLDPTFKLYNRPLSKPFPYRIRDGAEIEQRIEIDVVRMPARRRETTGHRRRSQWSTRLAPIPVLGVATAPGRVPSSSEVTEALARARPAFVLHRTNAGAAGLRAAARLARALGAELRVEAFGESAKLADTLKDVRPRRVAAYFSGPQVDAAISDAAMEKVGGTFADFVMLNRHGLPASPGRAAFALCPTVHARDDRSLIETLEAMPDVFAQARRLAGSRPVDAGPCTLLRRLVPATGKPVVRAPQKGGPYDVDSRQCEHIAAAWLACTIVLAAEAGIASVCTFEAAGSRGVVCGSADASGVRGARGIDGHSSSYQLLCALAAIGAERITLVDCDVRRGAAFLVHGKSPELWLVDLSGQPRPLPGGVVANASGMHLQRGRHGARWVTLRRADRVEAYAIARLQSIEATRAAYQSLSRAWCR
jgi:hypothetical protein